MSERRHRILVVDDTPRNVTLLADLLAASGYQVVTAASGAEALERVARERPDLVLLDVLMPGMNGYEVCRALRNDPTTAMLPVVMVTALEASTERVRGLEAGADDFLSKPPLRGESRPRTPPPAPRARARRSSRFPTRRRWRAGAAPCPRTSDSW